MPTSKLSNKQEAIDFYIDQNFVLFPLNGKIPPRGLAWRSCEFNPFFEAHTNFGVGLKSDDLVIDVDPRNFKDGVDSFKALCADLKIESLLTFYVETGSGGLHYYFKKPSSIKIRKNLKEYPGVDFLSEGCYVVGAGSSHPLTGRDYVCYPSPIRPANKALLGLIERKPVELVKTEGGLKGQYASDDQTRTRYIEYLKNAEEAIEGESGDQTTLKVAMVGRDYGLSPEVTFGCMSNFYNDRCSPPWDLDELQRKVLNAYTYAKENIGNKSPLVAFKKEDVELWTPEQDKYFHRHASNNNIKLDQHNVALMFAPTFPLDGLIAMDLFSHNIVFRRKAPWHNQHDNNVKVWNDDEASRCTHWLSRVYKFEPSQILMHAGALAASYQYQFHPVKEYFDTLVWDGHKRVHNWMHNYLGAEDNQYTRAVGLKTLVACVKRIYEPGCKFDYITVLEGRQDTFKSTAWRALAGEDWFGDTPIDISKEWSIMKTFGKLMYEWAEMETFRKSNTQAMKAFLSSSVDTVRLPYNRMSKDIPRSGIFVGSFNPERDKDIGWLHDTTGNRRYWVVATSITRSIQIEDLREVRDQLWAEALMLYHAGTPIYFEDSVVVKMAQDEQTKRMGRDSWADAIEIWLDAPHNIAQHVFTGDEIYKNCLGGVLTNYKRPEMVRISNVMLTLGWTKGSHWSPDRKTSVNGYRRPMVE